MNREQSTTPRWSAMVASIQGGKTADGAEEVTATEDYNNKSNQLGMLLEIELAQANEKVELRAEIIRNLMVEVEVRNKSITALEALMLRQRELFMADKSAEALSLTPEQCLSEWVELVKAASFTTCQEHGFEYSGACSHCRIIKQAQALLVKHGITGKE